MPRLTRAQRLQSTEAPCSDVIDHVAALVEHAGDAGSRRHEPRGAGCLVRGHVPRGGRGSRPHQGGQAAEGWQCHGLCLQLHAHAGQAADHLRGSMWVRCATRHGVGWCCSGGFRLCGGCWQAAASLLTLSTSGTASPKARTMLRETLPPHGSSSGSCWASRSTLRMRSPVSSATSRLAANARSSRCCTLCASSAAASSSCPNSGAIAHHAPFSSSNALSAMAACSAALHAAIALLPGWLWGQAAASVRSRLLTNN